MRLSHLSKKTRLVLASVLTVSLILVGGPTPATSVPLSVSERSSSNRPDLGRAPSVLSQQQQHRRADDETDAPAPSSKSDNSSNLVSPSINNPATVAQEPTHIHDDHGQSQPGTESTPIIPSTNPPQPLNKNAFRIVNPEPNDVWTSGKIETLSWEDLDLPDHVTYDITLVPEDPVSNPKALHLTRRPLLRYVVAEDRYLDIVVPYDLISRDQLLKVQESNLNLTAWASQQSNSTEPSIAPTPTSDTTPSPAPVLPSPSPGSVTIDTRVRLYITAYIGKTNKMIAQKSVYPLVIRKDPEWDRREPRPDLPEPPSTSPMADPEEQDAGHPGDILVKMDSELAHMDDYQNLSSDNATDDQDDEDEGEEGEEGHHHHHKFGDWVTENFDEEEEEESQDAEGEEAQNTEENSVDEPVDGIEDENVINAFTPTSDELGENIDDTAMDMEEHSHEGGEHSEGEEGHSHHDHSHVIDPNHFQNDEDVALWEEHMDDPGYNPPIRIEDAGTIQITQWVDNKERFFVGAPYVMAWSFPDESEGLTGTVNVYIEDAETAQRYDIVAGNLPSDVQFIYLRPSALLVSTIPKTKIFVRARVEMDLFWAGTIQRYTGFSKTFYVERGAL
ncbi:hypothetical protein FBU30_007265 [Linnemannia zychae]|nr:hypothetical protein FBU30_007265 [Linnemannia zychae]